MFCWVYRVFRWHWAYDGNDGTIRIKCPDKEFEQYDVRIRSELTQALPCPACGDLVVRPRRRCKWLRVGVKRNP